MALIKHARAGLLARDAVVLDLGDLHHQGEQMIALAKSQADRIVAEAKAERERILAGAADEGRAKGHAEGLAVGTKTGSSQGREAALAEWKPRLTELEQHWHEALNGFVEQREAMLTAAATDAVRLAALIAERITKRAIHLDPTLVVDQLRAVLGVIWRPTDLVVRVHPDDRPIVESALPGLLPVFQAVKHLELESDETLPRGSCVATSRAERSGGAGGGQSAGQSLGCIDASISTQLERIIEALLPGEVLPSSPTPTPALVAPAPTAAESPATVEPSPPEAPPEEASP